MSLKIKSSTTAEVPLDTDLVPREIAYSFVSGKLFIKNPLTNQIDEIGGKAFSDAINALNKLPIALAAQRAALDSSAALTGNLLTTFSDPEGQALTMVSLTYNAISRAFDTTFQARLGSMLVTSAGLYTFTPNDVARALGAGQTDSEDFSYTVMDPSGGRTTNVFHLTITGTNQGPVVRYDSKSVPAGVTAVGNVLVNDLDYEGQAMTVVDYSVSGIAGVKTPGTTTNIPLFGDLTVQANGAYTFVPLDANVSGVVPVITYHSTDGTNTGTGTLQISVAPPPPTQADMKAFYDSYLVPPVVTDSAPNPVTGRPMPDRTLVIPTASYERWNYFHRLPNQTGRPANALTFEVGPNKPYTDLDQVPWEMLLPGDRVLIYWRPTPYNRTIVINSSGTSDAWIEIIGVRNQDTGEMPVIDGESAICAPGQHVDIYDGAALITFGHMTTGTYGMVEGAKPRYIHVTGLELKNAHPTKTRTKKSGTTGPWGEFASAFYGIGFDNVCIQGNKMHHCGLGIFVNSILAERFQSRNLHVCNNWIYECSSIGSYSTHSAYTEAIGTIYEHNYIQKVISGSNGDTVKDRSCGTVFRYNYMEVSANAISLRDPSSENSNQNGWLEAQAVDSLGELMINSAFVYGNTFINRNSAPQSIVVIGDGANAEYRQGSLYFYSNVVISVVDGASGYTGIFYNPYRIPLFGLPSTRSPITVVARNNLFYTDKATSGGVVPQFGLFYWQGLADFQSNWINEYVNTAYDTAYIATLARGNQFNGAGIGGLVESTASPGFVGLGISDFSLLPASPFFTLNAAVPPTAVARSLLPLRQSVMYPFDKVPVPTMLVPPSITGNPVRGNVLTASGQAFSPLPDSYLYQWYRNGAAISGATQSTYTTVLEDEAMSLTVGVKPVNASAPAGGPEAISVAINVVTPTSPINTVAPVITGSGQVTFEHTVSNGTWTNNPISWEYQCYLNGVAVSGETTSSFTPVVGDVGKTLQWMVTATNAGGEHSFVMSNSITLAAVSYDPDNAGRWNFAAPDNTTVRTLSSKWNGIIAPFDLGFGQDDMTCQGGILRPTGAYSLWNNDRAWLEDGQSDNASVEASMVFTAADRGMSIGLRQTAGQYYSVNIGVDSIRISRNGTSVSQKTGMTNVSPAVLKVVPSAGTLQVYVNGVLEHTYTDSTPLTGGYPGVVSDRGGNTTLECGMEWWTDNPV